VWEALVSSRGFCRPLIPAYTAAMYRTGTSGGEGGRRKATGRQDMQEHKHMLMRRQQGAGAEAAAGRGPVEEDKDSMEKYFIDLCTFNGTPPCLLTYLWQIQVYEQIGILR
jgi:hypothetical protein